MRAPLIRAATTAAELRLWAREAEPGDAVEYHVGHLGADRQLRTAPSSLDALADAAMEMFAAGSLHLVQQRLGPRRFRYLAIRRSG